MDTDSLTLFNSRHSILYFCFKSPKKISKLDSYLSHLARALVPLRLVAINTHFLHSFTRHLRGSAREARAAWALIDFRFQLAIAKLIYGRR